MSSKRNNSQQSIEKRYLILATIGFFVVLIGGYVLIPKIMQSQRQPVEVMASLVDHQEALEQNLETAGANFDNPKIVLDPYGVSPLTAVVLFETEQMVAPEVTIVGKDELTSFSHTFESNKQHRLPIYGLYPDYANKVKIKIADITKEITIQTDPLPEDFAKVIDVQAQKEYLSSDLYFMTNSSVDSKTIAYDVNGDVRWYLKDKHGWEIKRSKQTGRIFVGTKRLYKEPYYRTGFFEIDLLGKIYAEYTVPGGYHHDLFEKSDGNIIVASGSTDDNRKTVEDVVVEIDRQTGQVVKTIDLAKIWPMDTGKSISWSADDWFHNNSVWLDEKSGELLLSGRHQDAVVVLDYESATVKYIIGSPDAWSAEMQKYFLHPIGDEFEWQWQQHSAKVLPNGDIILFDNGNHKTKNKDQSIPLEKSYSRAVIYRVNRADMTIEQIWQYGKERGMDYFSPYISDVDYLGENHFLVHSGGVNYIDGRPTGKPASLAKADKLRSFTTEILNNQVVFEIVNNQNQYRAEKMPVYIDGDKSLKLGRAKQLGSQARTHTCGDIPTKDARYQGNIYYKHKFKMVREYDRLVMNGLFDEQAVVRLSLVGQGTQFTYHVPIDNSEADSQALCIDIMNYDHKKSGTEKDVTFYVNTEGLSGTYQIYISIQDKVYRTGLEVEL